MSRANAAEAALAATMAARDANGSREILQQALTELPLLADAVEALNMGLVVVNERLSEVQPTEGDLVAQIEELKRQVDELTKIVKKDAKKKGNVD